MRAGGAEFGVEIYLYIETFCLCGYVNLFIGAGIGVLHLLGSSARGPDVFVVEIQCWSQRGIRQRCLTAVGGRVLRKGVEHLLIDLLFDLIGLDHAHIAGVMADLPLREVAVVER